MFGLAVTAGFFVVVETLLAILHVRPTLADQDPFVGFESRVPLFVENTKNGQVVLQTADNKLTYFNAQEFPKNKAEGTYRIFCLGGSTTYGRPFDDSTSFVAWLRGFLPIIDDSRSWEVINAGGISYASYRVAEIVDELSQYSPDLFVLYTGHNEFLEQRSYQHLKSTPASLRRVQTWLFNTRTFSLAAELAHPHWQPQSSRWMLPAEVDAVLDHAVGPTDYHRDPALRKDIVAHFEFNLERILQKATSVGAAVVMVTPACNVKDFSPFKSEYLKELSPDEQARWIEFYLQAEAMLAAGDYQTALERLDQASAIDAGRADLHFAIGKARFALGQHAAAELAFQNAIDNDICPLRAVSEITTLVRKTAIRHRVPLIDYAEILQNDCLPRWSHPLPGNEYFLDHVHPNIESHRLLGMALVEALIRMQVVTASEQWREPAVERVSAEIAAGVDAELQARGLTNLAQVLGWAGKQEEAGPVALQAVRLREEAGLPADPESLFYGAVHLATLGQDAQALDYLQRSLELQPNNFQARLRIAQLRYDRAEYALARSTLVTLVRDFPNSADAHHLLGMAQLQLGEFDQALAEFRRSNDLSPDSSTLESDLALVKQMQAESGQEPGK